jgi:hypothetical protein
MKPGTFVHTRFFRLIVITVLLLLSFTSFSQVNSNISPCATDQMRSLHGFSKIPLTMDKADLDIEDTELYYIPVVFHVIYDNKASGPYLLSDAVIRSQIKVLNEDFGKEKNTHGFNNRAIGADTRIRFCMASLDPNGMPTSGIERIQSAYTHAKSEDEQNLKDLSRWDQRYYLNVWIVQEILDNNAGRTAGYSYLAHDVSTKDNVNTLDGTVVNYAFVGLNNPFQSSPAYKLGRTLTHEIGHYCDMQHPWGDEDISVCGDDGVYDTPPCENAYYSKYINLCDSPFQCGFFRLVEDYMDYSDDRCMNIYTIGQAKKMRAALRKYRPNLISCPNRSRTACGTNCNNQKTYTTNDIELFPNPTSAGNINFSLFLDAEQQLDFYFYDNLGKLVGLRENINGAAGRVNLSMPGLRPGIYYIVVKGKSQLFHKQVMIYSAN